jgi:TetR/AcrR family tetracycline transcriptional repressor
MAARSAERKEATVQEAGAEKARGDRGDSLSRERIVRVALELVDREGLGALSMRRLGAELGVYPMAAYYYIPNKEALLDAIVEAVIADIDLTGDDPSDPPEDRILRAATAYRDALLAHLKALPLILSRAPNTPTAMRLVESLIGILRDAGLGPMEAFAGMNAIAASVRGAVGVMADELHEPTGPEELAAFAERFPAEEFPNLHATLLSAPTSFERAFEFGIRALARGLLAIVPGRDGATDTWAV